MRKKFIGVYALMAVLALGTTVTSCVDDTESPTVTAIRDAKLKQLQALASQAESQAKIDAIEAQIKEATSAAELAELQANLEAAIAQANLNKQQAEQQMVDNLTIYQANLYRAYTDATGKVNTLISEISKQKLALAEAKLDSAAAASLAKEMIAEKKMDILYQETLKASYEKLENADLSELNKKKAEAKVNFDAKDDALIAANDAMTTASSAFFDKKMELQRYYIIEGSNGKPTITFTKPSSGNYKVVEPTDEVAKAFADLIEIKNSPEFPNDFDLQNGLIASILIESEEDATVSIWKSELNANYVSRALRLINADIKDLKDDLGTSSDDETKPTAWGNNARLKKAVAAAEEAIKDVKEDDPTYPALAKNLEDAKIALENDSKEGGYLYEAQKDLADAEKLLTDFNAAVAVINDAAKYKAYADKIDAIMSNEGKAYVDTKKAVANAMEEWYIADAELTSATTLLANAEKANVVELIAQCEAKIASYKKDLYKYENLFGSSDGAPEPSFVVGTESHEALVAAAEYELACKQAEKELQQAMAEQYKSQLEASLKGEEPAPAE